MTALRSPFAGVFTTGDAEDLTAMLRALCNPWRLRMLHLMFHEGPITSAELVSFCYLTQPTVSHHLTKLRKAGLVTVARPRREDGRHIAVWSLSADALAALSGLLDPGGAR